MNIDFYLEHQDDCASDNYIDNLANKPLWTITNDIDHVVYYVGGFYFGDSLAKYSFDAYPTLFIKNDLSFKGEGTMNNPYKIVF